MDVGVFVQENKRWLLGCAIGGIAYLIGSAVLGSIFEASPPSAKSLGAPTTDVFDQAALSAAQTEQEQLVAERARLEKELAFVPTDKYLLANKGDPSQYFYQVGRGLKQTIAAAADQREVGFADNNVSWDQPSGADDYRGALFALELVDEVQKRLFAAHDASRSKAPECIGLRAITSLKPDRRSQQRSQVRTAKPGEVVIGDYLVEEQVQFDFLADEPTLARFLESCRQPGRTLVVEAWKVIEPTRPGEACQVKGSVRGIAFKEK
jgi:hypothetical protein